LAVLVRGIESPIVVSRFCFSFIHLLSKNRPQRHYLL